MAIIDGNDVSSYQPNWAPRQGQEFVGIKSTEGTSYANPYRDEQESKSRKADLVILWYHFLSHGNIDQQVAYFANNTNVKPGDILVCDWEKNGCTNADKDDYLKKLKKRFPKNRVILYCNVSWWLTKDKTSYVEDGLWIAYYSNNSSVRPPIQSPWLFYQYSQTPIDQNVSSFKTKAELVAWAKCSAPAVVIDTRAKVWFRGGWTCGCVATSLPLVEQDMIQKGLIKESIDIYQLGYRTDVSASAGTHAKGGCTDVDQYSDEQLQVWRDWGWTMEHRTPAEGFIDHGHGFPFGCTHLSAGAQYQVDEWRNKMNALSGSARGPVTGPGWQVIDWKDALKKKAGALVAKVNAATAELEKESEIVRERIAPARSKNQKAKAENKYQTLWLTNGDGKKDANCTVAFGPCSADFDVNITASGLGVKDKLWVRCYTVDYVNGKPKRNKGSESKALEIDNNGGWARKQVSFKPVVGSPSKGHSSRRLRLEWMTTNKDVQIEDCWIQGWSEK